MNLTTLFRIHYFLYWGSISAVLNFGVLFITKYGEVTPDQTGEHTLARETPNLIEPFEQAFFTEPYRCS